MKTIFFLTLFSTLQLNDVFSSTKISYSLQEGDYEKSIKDGNYARDIGNFDEAIAHFETALKYKPNDKYATEQILICKEKKAAREKEYEAMTEKILTVADDYYNKAEYAEALKLYERYLKLRPESKSVKKKIKKCRQKLK